MTDNKRAADDAERQFTEWFAKNYPGPDTIIYDPLWHAPKILRAARAALSARADGGKDLRQRILDALDMKGTFTDDQIVDAVWCSDYERRRLFVADGGKGEASLTRWQKAQMAFGGTAPQAECAPREAQPVAPRTTLNYDGTFDTTCAHCGGNGCFACLKSAAPTPERADADTAGAKPTCPHCGLTDIEFSRVCHNSACSGYAKEESFYRGWENTAAPASQERADAGKDAALKQALDALKQGKQFIVNGVEFGFIRMPEPGDPALYTLPTINAAIDAILAANKELK